MARLEERADAAFPDPPLTGPATEPAEVHSTPATTSEAPEEDVRSSTRDTLPAQVPAGQVASEAPAAGNARPTP